jgi:hypothetical protein
MPERLGFDLVATWLSDICGKFCCPGFGGGTTTCQTVQFDAQSDISGAAWAMAWAKSKKSQKIK